MVATRNRMGRLLQFDAWKTELQVNCNLENHRTIRLAAQIRIRLGGSGSLAEPVPPKPARMHWETYRRLCAKLEQRETIVFGALAAFVEQLETCR